jgi:hypothetical protein
MKRFEKIIISSICIFSSFSACPSSDQETSDIIDRMGNQVLYCRPYIMVYVNDANESIGFIIPKQATFSEYKYLVKTISGDHAQSGAFKFDSGNSLDCEKAVKLNNLFRIVYYKEDDKNYLKANASYEFPHFENQIGLYKPGNGKYLFSFSKKEYFQSYVLTIMNSYLKCENNNWCSLTKSIDESLDVQVIPYNHTAYEKAKD